ncbi:hypothetical protein [uncultured Stenotrophomonas sp.]|uniref:hypothetical protein n=1 Tax=uncultured Stenotrophomonas sp. TaxID=165438 RepID=UPI0028EDCCF3|nr:hypothetical protein [uncultured Stenotrophomonas sp.]
MNRIYIGVAIALVTLAFWAGWEWRDRSADLAVANADLKQAVAVVDQVNDTRAIEHTQAQDVAAIGVKHEEDRTAAASLPAAVIAELRADRLRMRDGWSSCETQRVSDAAAATGERDAATQRREEFAGAVVRAGRDADDQLRACQAVIAADRAEVSP